MIHLLRRTAFLAAALLPCFAAEAEGDSGAQAFEVIRSVLQHPRCQNCHIPIDAPLQFNEGRVHAMNVKRGPKGHGAAAMECSVCHGEQNLPARIVMQLRDTRGAGLSLLLKFVLFDFR